MKDEKFSLSLCQKNMSLCLKHLYVAYYDARRHKRNTKSQRRFEAHMDHHLVRLYHDIVTRRYRPSRCMCFITEDPVKREIFASPFRDRVVHHLVYNYISPLFERQFIFDSYSCRNGKGTLHAVQRYEHHIRACSQNYQRSCYILQLDLRGYFMSIDKKLLYAIIMDTLRKKAHTKSPDGRTWNQVIDMELTEYLITTILRRNPTHRALIVGDPADWKGLPSTKSLFGQPEGIGLPIGDLTSQLFSNIYLNELDHYCKRTLQCHHYGRYVDDFYIIGEDPEWLKSLIPKIRDFLWERLHVRLHPNKIKLTNARKGTRFLGAYIMPYHTLPGKRVTGKFKRAAMQAAHICATEPFSQARAEQLRATLNSYLGLLCHYRSFRLRKWALDVDALRLWFIIPPDYNKVIIRKDPQKPSLVSVKKSLPQPSQREGAPGD